MFLFHKFTFHWCILVISVQLASGEWVDQTISNFKEGLLGGMGGTCLEQDLLEVKKYEDFVAVFEEPDGANEYFATSSEGISKHCIENVGAFISDAGYEVRLLLYTKNIGGPDAFRFSVFDLLNAEQLTTEVEIENENWTYSIIKLTRRSNYKVSVFCSLGILYYHSF